MTGIKPNSQVPPHILATRQKKRAAKARRLALIEAEVIAQMPAGRRDLVIRAQQELTELERDIMTAKQAGDTATADRLRPRIMALRELVQAVLGEAEELAREVTRLKRQRREAVQARSRARRLGEDQLAAAQARVDAIDASLRNLAAAPARTAEQARLGSLMRAAPRGGHER